MAILDRALDAEVLIDAHWHELVDSNDSDLWALSGRFFQAYEKHDDHEAPAAQLLKLLAAACSLQLSEGAKPPFQPMIVFFKEGKRSSALEDFGIHDIDALASVCATAPTALTRARFADLALTVGIEHKHVPWKVGPLAVEAYLEISEPSLATDKGVEVLEYFIRGFQLLRVYAKRNDALSNRYWALGHAAILFGLDHDAPGVSFTLLRVMRHKDAQWLDEMADLLTKAGTSNQEKDLDTAARCFELASIYHRRSQREAEARVAAQAQGEALIARALLGTSAMTQSIRLAEGIAVLRRAGGDKARITELQQQLTDLQRQSMSEFGRIEHTWDATELVRAIERIVVGPTIVDCLLQMTFDAWDWPHFDRDRAAVIERASKFVLSSLFGEQQMDAEGLVVAQADAFDANDPESVYSAMVRQHRDFDIKMRSDVLVARCVSLLFNGYHPSLYHIHEVVSMSRVVPPDRHQSLARGFLAGINRDWLEAAVYLIPQAESLVRHLFRLNNIVTITLRDNGTQEEKNLYELLDSEHAERILGKNLILELKTLLTHPMGYRLRNVWAHGLATDSRIVNHGLLSLWWTLWRMVLWPIAVELREDNGQDPPAPEPDASAS